MGQTMIIRNCFRFYIKNILFIITIMNKYKISLWGEYFDKAIIIESDNNSNNGLDTVISYLWNEKEKIEKIMKINNELILYKDNNKTFLHCNQYNCSLWFDLDTSKVTVCPKIQEKIEICDITYKQFHNLILIMYNDLTDDYGGSYIGLEKEVSNKYGKYWTNL